MSLEQNKAIVLKMYEAFDKQDIEQGRKLMSPNIIGRGMDTTLRKGVDEFMQYAMSSFAAFPDGYHVIEEVIAEDNKVVTRGTFKGTHQGELMGIPATGKQVKFSFIHIDTLSDGKVIEHWGQADVFGMMHQLKLNKAIE
ncbi:MAG: ester cyclase [Cyanobacteriota bacterium]|nr:ester cyclase [Cyanobacteriota bacterium]